MAKSQKPQKPQPKSNKSKLSIGSIVRITKTPPVVGCWQVASFFGSLVNLRDMYTGRVMPAVQGKDVEPMSIRREDSADVLCSCGGENTIPDDANSWICTSCGKVQHRAAQEGEKSADPTHSVLSATGTTPSMPYGALDDTRDHWNGVETQVPAPASIALPSAPPAADPAMSKLRARMSATQQASRSDDKLPAAGERKPGCHLIVRARAGTGKTTTAVEGIRAMLGLTPRVQPSPQQKDVWDALAESAADAKSICMTAFNNSIAAELERKLSGLSGIGGRQVLAMTMHRMGNAAVRKAFGGLRDPNKWRTDDIIEELMGRDIRDLRRERTGFLTAVKQLVSQCKNGLADPIKEGRGVLDFFVSHFQMDIDESEEEEIFEMVGKVLERSKDVRKSGCIDFDDMIWLPLVLNLPIPKYDLLLVDEAQDLNKSRQELAMRAGRRIVLIGDNRQAVYGFTGADVEGLDTMFGRLSATDRGCIVLPLTVTRRCGKAIVEEARQEVPDFEAHESNGPGKISHAKYPIPPKSSNYWTAGQARTELPYEETYMPLVQQGDMILCRCNAPLVSQCFRFLKRGVKAYIQGRDIGDGIIRMIEGFKAADVKELVQKVCEWAQNETEKENRKRNPSDDKLIAIEDKMSCLLCFCEDAKTVAEIVTKVRTIFTDGRCCPKCGKQASNDMKECFGCKVAFVPVPGIRLSSIHKAKGLEAPRVFLLQVEGASVPHPMAKTKWQIGQEHNLLYVAITRAIEELIYVS